MALYFFYSIYDVMVITKKIYHENNILLISKNKTRVCFVQTKR